MHMQTLSVFSDNCKKNAPRRVNSMHEMLHEAGGTVLREIQSEYLLIMQVRTESWRKKNSDTRHLTRTCTGRESVSNLCHTFVIMLVCTVCALII